VALSHFVKEGHVQLTVAADEDHYLLLSHKTRQKNRRILAGKRENVNKNVYEANKQSLPYL
jgi:hypothetical protein